jgi:aquaporin TIP
MSFSDHKNFVELFGTFVFCLSINMSLGESIIDLCVSLFIAIILTRNISGGHVNSAVTLGFTIDNIYHKGKEASCELLNFAYYSIFQILGALLACLVSFVFYNREVISFIDKTETPLGIVFAEVSATFLFVFSILIQSENRFTKNKVVSSLIIAISLGVCALAVQGFSKGCLNSSVLLASAIAYGHWNVRILYYLFSELLGGLLAGLAYRYIYRNLVDEEDNDKNLEYALLNDNENKGIN